MHPAHVSPILLLAATAAAQVDNLRITEVAPHADQVEVTNTGPAFVTPAAFPFSHGANTASSIPSGTAFAAGEVKVFTVAGLDDADSDLWLYRAPAFGVPANVVHGVKYGPSANVGQTATAVAGGVWPSATAFVPAPSAAQTLGFDGLGSAPHDWFVDDSPSLGQNDPVPTGTVTGGLVVPVGSEGLEAVPLGDTSLSLVGWVTVDTGTVGGDFDVRVIGDVQGAPSPAPVPGSSRWLRVRDQDGAAVQNRAYSNFLNTGGVVLPYEMAFHVNPLELPPASAGTRPRIVVQHTVSGVPTNAFGVEFDAAGADLVVLASAGPAALLPIAPLPLGGWSRVVLRVDFAAGTVSASVGGSPEVVAPIALAAGFDAGNLRYCYRGEGAGNVATMLLDEIAFTFGEPAQEVVRLGSPANPNVLLPGQTSGPVLGAVWDPRIQPFVAGNQLDLLVIAGRSTVNASVPGITGTVLLDVTSPFLTTIVAPPAQPFAFAIPNSIFLMGFELSTQGASLGPASIELTNALDLVLGT
jgi:hypothetical protein